MHTKLAPISARNTLGDNFTHSWLSIQRDARGASFFQWIYSFWRFSLCLDYDWSPSRRNSVRDMLPRSHYMFLEINLKEGWEDLTLEGSIFLFDQNVQGSPTWSQMQNGHQWDDEGAWQEQDQSLPCRFRNCLNRVSVHIREHMQLCVHLGKLSPLTCVDPMHSVTECRKPEEWNRTPRSRSSLPISLVALERMVTLCSSTCLFKSQPHWVQQRLLQVHLWVLL